MKERKTKMKKLLVGLKVALSAGALCASSPLSLDSDTTIDVPSGDTVTYSTLSGGAYTLTKTGGGTIVFETISNASAKVVVSAGTLDVRTVVPAKPAILSSAYLHLDATDLSTMTYTESDGVTYVSQWRDVNGGDIVLKSVDNNHKPFITTSFRNGRNVMDLGAIRHSGMAAGLGYGAFFRIYKSNSASSCSTMKEAFLVVGDTEDAKRSFIDYGKPYAESFPAKSTPILGTYGLGSTTAPFLRGSIESFDGLSNSALIYATTTLGYTKYNWTLNSTDVANATTVILPDGLNVVEIRAKDANPGVSFDSLGSERDYYFGGLRYGEVAIFDEPLSAADREAVRAYLYARWLPTELAGVELGEGATLTLANDVTLRVGKFKASGSASVTGGGSLKIVDVDRTGEGRLTFAQSSQTIRPDASGLLPDMSFPSGGTINAVGVSARAGHVAVTGTFAKTGDGALALMDINDGAAISVEKGTLTIDPQIAADASWMHLDASITNSTSMTLGIESGTNVVTEWKDPRDKYIYAYQRTSGRNPWLIPNVANGHSVLDFGGFKCGSIANARGAFMNWATGSKTLRDVFTVASDTEDLDWNYDNLVTADATHGKRGAPFVGNTGRTYGNISTDGNEHPEFLRSTRSNVSQRPGILLSSVAIYNTASVMVDGESVAKNSAYPKGFHVVNIRTGRDAYGNSFAIDRSNLYGGTRIGEFVAFTNEVPERARRALNLGLMSKWLGGDKAFVHACGAVSVAQGATLALPYQTLAPTGLASIDGTISAGRLALSGNAQFGANASLTGDLELANGASIVLPSTAKTGDWSLSVGKLVLNGGTVNLSFAAGGAKPVKGTMMKLISSTSLEGTASINVEGYDARVVVGNDGLYLEFLKKGFVLTYR